MFATLQCIKQCVLNDSCVFGQANVTKHCDTTEQECGWIGNIFSGNIRCCPVYCFKNRDMVTDVCRRCKSKPANESRTQITYNITLQVGEYQYIKLVGARYQFH